MECIENNPTMEGRIVEATELIGMVPKIMKQGGLTDEDRSRVVKIMKNFNKTKQNLELQGKFTKVDKERYDSMLQAYTMLQSLPDIGPEALLQLSISRITAEELERKDSKNNIFVCNDDESKLSWGIDGYAR